MSPEWGEPKGNDRTARKQQLPAAWLAVVRILNVILKCKGEGTRSEGCKQSSEMRYFTCLNIHSNHCRKDCRGPRVQPETNYAVEVERLSWFLEAALEVEESGRM